MSASKAIRFARNRRQARCQLLSIGRVRPKPSQSVNTCWDARSPTKPSSVAESTLSSEIIAAHLCACSIEPYARIDNRIQNVSNKISDDDENREHERDAHHQGVILVVDSGDGEPAHSWVGEDILDN